VEVITNYIENTKDEFALKRSEIHPLANGLMGINSESFNRFQPFYSKLKDYIFISIYKIISDTNDSAKWIRNCFVYSQ